MRGVCALVNWHAGHTVSGARTARLSTCQRAQPHASGAHCRRIAQFRPLHCNPDPDGSESSEYVTATDSAQVTPTGGGPVVVTRAERIGTRAPAAVLAERRAWLVMWLAFATFCALVFAAAKFTLDYVRTAEVDQSAH